MSYKSFMTQTWATFHDCLNLSALLTVMNSFSFDEQIRMFKQDVCSTLINLSHNEIRVLLNTRSTFKEKLQKNLV